MIGDTLEADAVGPATAGLQGFHLQREGCPVPQQFTNLLAFADFIVQGQGDERSGRCLPVYLLLLVGKQPDVAGSSHLSDPLQRLFLRWLAGDSVDVDRPI